MKLFLLLLLLPFAAAQSVDEWAAGPYTIQLTTLPEQLEPGHSNLIINVLKDNESVIAKDVWMRLSEGQKVYFAGTFRTDNSGAVSVSYLFNGPGNYDLTVEVDGNRASIPMQVHGQYLLMFGFLAAVFIVLALLMDRI